MSTNVIMNPPVPSLTNEADLRAAGFSPGAPAHLKALERNADWETCREATCDLCGHEGLEFAPWHKGHQYRFLMVCSACGYSSEG